MTTEPFQIEIDDDGRRLAWAGVELTGPAACVELHIEAGQLPCGTRTRLVDAVLDRLATCGCREVRVSLPSGDTEILDRIRECCDAGDARSAGSTCLVEAGLRAGGGRTVPA